VSITIGEVRLEQPVILAPMSGVTDRPFRRLVSRLGAGLVVSEMIASEAVVRETRRSVKESRKLSEHAGECFPLAVQLAGCEPAVMAEAAKLNEGQRRALVEVVEAGPDPAIHGVVRWRLADLVQWVLEEFRIQISVQTLSRELRALGYRKLSARPHHYAQDPDAMAAFKKTSPPSWRRSRPRRPRASI